MVSVPHPSRVIRETVQGSESTRHQNTFPCSLTCSVYRKNPTRDNGFKFSQDVLGRFNLSNMKASAIFFICNDLLIHYFIYFIHFIFVRSPQHNEGYLVSVDYYC